MQIKKITQIFILGCFAPSAFAMFCPGNFNEINIGDSLASVLQQCGKPATQKVSDATENLPQEWIYFTKTQPTDQTSLRMTIAFNKGIATNITVNSVGVATTQICGGNSATVGATEEQIKKACGGPAYIRKSNNPNGTVLDVTKVTTLTYPGTPEVTLTFENDLLKSRQ